MSEDIFRKKSLDKIKSPESLNDYLRVVNPGIWLLLSAVIVLLVGAGIWGEFGHIEAKVTLNAQVTNGTAVCFVSSADAVGIQIGMPMVIDETVGRVETITFDSADNTYCIKAAVGVPDGIYVAEIVTESLKPISFVLN